MATTRILEDAIDTTQLLKVLTAVKKGNFAVRMPLDSDGVAGKIYDALNDIIDMNDRLSKELERISSSVGKEGKLTQRASLPGSSGRWKSSMEAINNLITNLVQPTTEMARVINAVAKGDLTQKVSTEVEGRPLRGEFLRTARVVNGMVDQLSSFASEVTRVAREVGTEGKLGGQAVVKGVTGTWKDLTDNVNSMANNLTSQVRNIAEVTTAVARGDLSKKITVDVRGEILELKNTINTMVDQLSVFASEVTRVAREVGTEGRLGGQAVVRGVAGTWKDLTDTVNAMASNLTSQVRNIAQVTTAVATGDLSKKITVDVKGEIAELKDTINTMVDQLNSFASEVTRVAREVGTEGKLGGQAQVTGVGGTWKDLTETVNAMASNLTGQVRNIAEVATAIARGNLSKKITVDVKGEIAELKDTINTMVDQLNSFASEVTRVAREVGTEGKLGGQAKVEGVAGTWKDLTDTVNSMASNLTNQVRNIAEVSTAIARGDLSKKITVDVQGEILALKETINTMVDQLSSFAAEVTRVAREVGTEGKLGGQAKVDGVAGTWKDLTDNVNSMASNLTSQVRNIAEVTTAVALGDLTKKITVDVKGEIAQLKGTINTMVDQLSSFAAEVTRVAREVGTEGKLGGQAVVRGVGGTWKDLTDTVNSMASNLTNQVRNIAEVATAIARGDLSRKITVDVRGEILELKITINTMVDQLSSFGSEVTRVAREVGTEGKLGGQAIVQGVGGTWKDLTDNVNSMASNLTNQVRNIAQVATAIARGDLSRKITVDVKGEMLELKNTINTMVDQLSSFGSEVTRVAREVGTEGKLGGQARVQGVAGTWKDLTDNVNLLAANLTTQVRAISDVATAVAKGDLSRSIQVVAAGEVAALKDNVNEMIRNLKETTQINTAQDWLKTHMAKFSRMLQGQRDLLTVSRKVLSDLAPLVNAQYGVFYLADDHEDPTLRLLATYAYKPRKGQPTEIRFGEGLVGQCAIEKQMSLLNNLPDNYVHVSSGLGSAPPRNVIVLPVLFEGTTKAVIELASMEPFSELHLTLLEQLADALGVVINTISANERTEELLKQSQQMTEELQKQQEKLRHTNAELEEKALLLAQQKREVEIKNAEVEFAKRTIEEKANQLALTSKYKSEFLANMSHELRTPLNSLLILSKMLSENTDGNLSERQVEFAETIYSSGNDLLELINEILDLSKIESGTMAVDKTDVSFRDLQEYVERTFSQIAVNKGLEFRIRVDDALTPSMHTDVKRLQQVLKNLLSNAFKFTDAGEVELSIFSATEGWSPGHPTLGAGDQVVAFSVRDTGIGIPADKQKIIFEAFQQADGTTSRKYGGTGLGLSISREIAKLLGGELRVTSNPGEGSMFTLFVPVGDVARTWTAAPVLQPSEKVHRPERERERGESYPLFSGDDRDIVQADDLSVLIIEDDPHYAQILVDAARATGFRGVVATNGAAALRDARTLRPQAITLDIRLPDMDGWAVLDRLKHDPATRHIPVHIVSIDEALHRGMRLGAYAFVQKPSDRAQVEGIFARLKSFSERPVRRMLLVEDDDVQRRSLRELIGHEDIEIDEARSGEEAVVKLGSDRFDCIVLDLGLPDVEGIELVRRVKEAAGPVPIIIYTGRDLAPQEETELRRYAESIVVKGPSAPERLLDETVLFLHRVYTGLSNNQREMIQAAHLNEPLLDGRKVLIVDDDVRNIYALTSVLERYRMNVVHAENGRDAISRLQNQTDIDIVLMDVMMPEMDGYETMRSIRRIPRLAALPIIAVTAKAMKGDREKCLEAGASEYITKPVDPEHLASLLRILLSREGRTC